MLLRTSLLILASFLAVISLSTVARAQAEPAVPTQTSPARSTAFEVNVLWPFFPGGVSELKLIVPAVRRTERDWHGDLVLGLHSDFATRFVRSSDKYGRVSILSAKLGYRQFLLWGLHLEACVNAGWRHEEDNVWDGTTIDGFTARLWLLAGYQHDLGSRAYFNVRGGIGPHLVRTGPFADKERKLTGGGDVNLGFWL
jgi:hypothetical protein